MKSSIIPLLVIASTAVANTDSAEAPAAKNEGRIHSETANELEEMTVWGRSISLTGSADSASHGLVGYADLSTRPMLRVGELVEVVPGMVATQHSGAGKANQYFLRGMNLDHGTDFAVYFEGVPVNFRTHAHGQGYLDINFMIPEVVEKVEYRKGTYYADTGDFSAAGSAQFKIYDKLERGFVEASIGGDGYRRLVAADSIELSNGSLLFAGEVQSQDGPWELAEDVKKYNGLMKYTTMVDDAAVQVIATAYSNSWNATDQIPMAEVEAGRLGRFGFVDPDIGGETSRYSLIAKAELGNYSANLYGIAYDLNLFSNPTYFLDDPINGDEIEQEDSRHIYGGSLKHKKDTTIAGYRVTHHSGLEFRYDDISDTNLFKTVGRKRIESKIDDEVQELSASLFAEAQVFWTDRLRTTMGVRSDYYNWDVDAQVLADVANSGSGSDVIVTPKFAMAYKVADKTELYANYGHGFHSNDVRGVEVEDNPVDALVRIKGAEVGIRTEAIENLNLTLTAFWQETDSELIFVGDAGTTEASDGAKRSGLELSAFWQANDWLVFDLTAAKTKARVTGKPSGEDYVSDAHDLVAGAGVTATMANGFTGALRVRHFGAAPLNEDNSEEKSSTTLVNLGLSYDFGKFGVGLDVLNLLDTEANDIAYFFESQLQGQSAREDNHFHPVAPRTLRASVRYEF